jgi:hypothetical protein
MKQWNKIALALAVPGMMLMSCEKSQPLPGGAASGDSQGDRLIEVLKNPTANAEFAKAILPYVKVSSVAKGASFIMPLGTGDGFGVLKDLVVDTTGPVPVIVSGEIGNFDAPLDGNDYWRENPDGSVSIHVTSNTAHGEHFDFATGETYTGEKCHLSMNYTGYLMEICFPGGPNGELICFTVFDFSLGKNAVNWTGNGKVSLNGQARQLSAKVVLPQGGTHTNVSLELK